MQTRQQSGEPEFWSDVYCGRRIAVFNRYGRWHVYLDHVLQNNVVFETAENAILWLTERVNAGIPARLN